MLRTAAASVNLAIVALCMNYASNNGSGTGQRPNAVEADIRSVPGIVLQFKIGGAPNGKVKTSSAKDDSAKMDEAVISREQAPTDDSGKRVDAFERTGSSEGQDVQLVKVARAMIAIGQLEDAVALLRKAARRGNAEAAAMLVSIRRTDDQK